MRKLLLLGLLVVGFGANAQDQSKEKELGEFCYVDSLSTKLVFNETCTVMQKLNFVKVQFKSKYAFSLQDEKSKVIYEIVSKVDGLGKETQREKLGDIPAVFLDGLTKTKNAANNGFEIAHGMNQSVQVYYHLGDLVLIFPKLTNKGLVSPAHRVYIPSECINDFKNIFK